VALADTGASNANAAMTVTETAEENANCLLIALTHTMLTEFIISTA
jgi:hypothetical protein